MTDRSDGPDHGLAHIETLITCYLAGLREPGHAASGPMGGAIFETAVVAEIAKTIIHCGEEPQVYFGALPQARRWISSLDRWQTRPIEVKLSATPRPPMAAGIRVFQQTFGDRAVGGYVIHPGDTRLPLAPGVIAVPFAEL